MPAPAVVPRPPHKDTDAMSLGPLAGVVGFHIAQAAVTTADTFERHIGARFKLRKVEYSLLMLMLLLLLANQALAPKRLAHALALTAPMLTMLLDRLQERGLLRRERNPADGRSQPIVLTVAGLGTARKSAAAAGPMEAELNSSLTRAEHAMLIELLCTLARRAAPG